MLSGELALRYRLKASYLFLHEAECNLQFGQQCLLFGETSTLLKEGNETLKEPYTVHEVVMFFARASSEAGEYHLPFLLEGIETSSRPIVTYAIHLMDDEKPSVKLGHFIGNEDAESACWLSVRSYKSREFWVGRAFHYQVVDEMPIPLARCYPNFITLQIRGYVSQNVFRVDTHFSFLRMVFSC